MKFVKKHHYFVAPYFSYDGEMCLSMNYNETLQDSPCKDKEHPLN